MQFWLPHYMKDVEVLERMQKLLTRTLPELRSFSYNDRLDKLGLFSLAVCFQTSKFFDVVMRGLIKLSCGCFEYLKCI